MARIIYEKYIHHNLWFKILSSVAVLLICGSFFVPPLGAIEPSVIAGVGEIFAFTALWTVVKAIDNGKKASITHGQTTLSVDDQQDEES